MHLNNISRRRHNFWIRRFLKWAGCTYHILRIKIACSRLHMKPCSSDMGFDGFHCNTRFYRCLYHRRIIFKISCNAVFVGKGIVIAFKFHTWKTVVPCWPIRHKRVPAFRPPTFCNATAFKDHMFDIIAPQMFACCNATLACSDH